MFIRNNEIPFTKLLKTGGTNRHDPFRNSRNINREVLGMRFFKFRDNTNNIPIRDVCFHKQPIHKNLSSILIRFVINTYLEIVPDHKSSERFCNAGEHRLYCPRARATAFMRL